MTIRPFDDRSDCYDELTRLLHAAYRPLADAGLNYVAATQDASVTRTRIGMATACWIAKSRDSRIVGTICYYTRGRGETGPSWYERNDVAHFGQFAVSPELQTSGIGSALLETVQRRALEDGKTFLACDTAEPAAHLLRFYRKRGFESVGRHRWPHARYDSIVLSKPLCHEDAPLG